MKSQSVIDAAFRSQSVTDTVTKSQTVSDAAFRSQSVTDTVTKSQTVTDNSLGETGELSGRAPDS